METAQHKFEEVKEGVKIAIKDILESNLSLEEKEKELETYILDLAVFCFRYGRFGDAGYE